jgi:hypothetical protein
MNRQFWFQLVIGTIELKSESGLSFYLCVKLEQKYMSFLKKIKTD